MILASLLLSASIAWAHTHPKEPPRLKSLEELRALCDQMQNEANRVVAPIPSKACGAFLGGSLDGSRNELKKEFEGNGGVVRYCRELVQRLQDLRRYRSEVQAGCTAASTQSAQASANTKSKRQDALVNDAASSRAQIGQQQAGCAGAIAPLVSVDPSEYSIRPATVPEPAPAKAPKDNYTKIGKDIVNRQTQFIHRTTQNGGAASQRNDLNSCGAQAREYLKLTSKTRENFDRMNGFVADEQDRTVTELESYRKAATTFSGTAGELKKLTNQLGTQPKAPLLYDHDD